MTKPRQILIFGCPRSGTSLLQSILATGFEGCWKPPQFEQQPSAYFWQEVWPQLPDPKPTVVVWKVPELPVLKIPLYRELIAEGCQVIGIMRHPRSILTSKQGGKPYWDEVAPNLGRTGLRNVLQRWTALANVMLEHQARKDEHFRMVRFEDLMARPDEVQAELGTWLGLEIACPFSACHERMDEHDPNAIAMNGVRPLDPSRAQIPSIEELRALGLELPEPSRFLLRACGYEVEADPLPGTTQGPVSYRPVMIGGGRQFPGWTVMMSPFDAGQFDVSRFAVALIRATYGIQSNDVRAFEGPCPIPGHDHAVQILQRGGSPLVVMLCPETQDWIIGDMGGQDVKLTGLPEKPQTSAD